jgi:hypothetical protein
MSMTAFAFLVLMPSALPASTDLSDFALPARAKISAVLGKEQAAYHAHAVDNGFRMINPEHQFSGTFTPSGVRIETGRAGWSMALQGYGYGTHLDPVAIASPSAANNRIEYRRGALTEWYVNGPLGLEQGFTIEQRPDRGHTGLLTLALTLSGIATTARVTADTLVLNSVGVDRLHYRGLVAFDATGRELASSIHIHAGRLELRVDDAGARYPLVIDPFIQQAKLISSDGIADDRFGYSVAMHGETVVVGAVFADIGANSAQGAAYVFEKPPAEWSGTLTQSAKLTASDGAAGDTLGGSVAISGDAIVVSASAAKIGANSFQGAAYVFVKPPGGWSGTLTENAKLTSSDGAGSDTFGSAVAISGDVIVVGAQNDNVTTLGEGSAYIFVKPVTGWNGALTQTAKLIASDAGIEDEFGVSVAISGDTVVVGSHLDDSPSFNQGSAYVFLKPLTGWAGTLAENAKLTASDGAMNDSFGAAVAVAGDTIVVGSFLDDVGGNMDQGSAYVFVKPPGGWSGILTESARLQASDGSAEDRFGRAAGIDGTNIIVGAPLDDIGGNADQGSVYLFRMPAGGWSGTLTETSKHLSSDGAAGDHFGWDVSMSGDSVVVGAEFDDIGAHLNQGSAYVFGNGFDFCGFFPPVHNPGAGPFPFLNPRKAGSAAPVKFSLGGDHGPAIFAAGFPVSEPVSCATVDSLGAATPTAGFLTHSHLWILDYYNYVWKTEKSWAGTCRKLTVRLSDGTDHAAYFTFH